MRLQALTRSHAAPPGSSSASSPRYTGTAQPVRFTCRSSPTSTSSSPPSRRTVTGLSPPRRTWATAAPRGAGAGGQRLPHPALEDPRADDPGATLADERDVRAVREQLVVLDRRGRSRAGRAPRARRRRRSRTAGCRSTTCWKRHSRPPAVSSPRRRRRRREVARAQPRAAHVDRAGRRAGDRRPDLARRRLDRERVASVQPARRRYMIASRAPLPDSSASEPSGLKIRSRATKPALVGLGEQQHAVGADAECAARTGARTRAGVSSNGSSAASTIT